MLDRQPYYRALETHFLSYQELKDVVVDDNTEPMVPLSHSFTGRIYVSDEDMFEYTGNEIFVRETVVALLNGAQSSLREIMPSCDLEVVYGYRHLDIQTKKFEAEKMRVLAISPTLSGMDLLETIHRFIAVPEVAGHPTGGAVDVRIVDENGRPLDMGTELMDFSSDTYVSSPFISRDAWQNRQLLRACMIKSGFAPFEGEWWHFSYGDREWARYYCKPSAKYTQLRFSSIKF